MELMKRQTSLPFSQYLLRVPTEDTTNGIILIFARAYKKSNHVRETKRLS